MSLEEKLHNFSKVLLVESLPFDTEKSEEQRADIERELIEIYEKPIKIELISSKDITNDSFLGRNDCLVIFNSQSYEGDPICNIPSLLNARALSEKLKQLSPNSNYSVLNSLGKIGSDGPLRMALEMVLNAFDKKDDGFIDHLIGDRPNFERTTLLVYLDQQTGYIRHKVGGQKDSAFIRELSERYMDGNCQTSKEKTFLIISNRLEGLRGKFDVVNQDTDFSDIDFSKYAAIFVDNNYSFKYRGESKLGSGIKVVEKLSALGIRVPIVYQTAHLLEDFTDEDNKILGKFDNLLLMPKNRAFKICRPEQARKEISVSNITSSDETLSSYCVKVHPIGEKGYIEHEGNAILATDAVHDLNNVKPLGDALYPHRMAVLAAFHTDTVDQLGNPIFTNTIDYLKPWDSIKEGLENFGFGLDKKTGELYSRLREKHLSEKPTTIIHNDPKWDNWFKGYVLGDFSDCGPGTEYKDLARALLDKETDFTLIFDDSWVDFNIEIYVSSRRQLDLNFRMTEDFETKVKELIFIESLRLARFEAQNNNRNIAEKLLSVARHYEEALCDSYRTIPKRGESAPYNNLAISI